MNKVKLLIGFGLLLALVGFYALIGCPFRFFLGICCPGCGMTRAMLALLHGDFALASYYHPLWWLAILIGFYVVVRTSGYWTLPVKYERCLVFIAGVVIFSVYYIRLSGGSPIVYWDYSRGFLSQWLMK
jgi:hypothetical protein